MDRRIFKNLIISFCLLYSHSITANMIVSDPTNGIHLISIISQAKESINKLKEMNSYLNETQKVLGECGIANNYISMNYDMTFDQWLHQLIELDKGQMTFSLFKLPNHDDYSNEHTYDSIEQDVADKLFVDNNNLSIQGYNEFRLNQQTILKQAIKSSYALSGIKQVNLQKSRDALEKISSNMMKTTNLREDINNTNQLLTLVVQELIQMREIQAKQLEVMSTMYLQTTEEVLKTEPLLVNREL